MPPEGLSGATGHEPPHPSATGGSGADSAGRPWEGRSFASHDTAYAADDGSADPRLLGALHAFQAREVGAEAVVDALREARLLIPLMAHAGDHGVNEHGVTVDKTQELAIVTVAGPDGRSVLPAFTSVAALSAWDPAARPVPAESRRVAIAAASEQTQLLVLDPGSETEFGLRRPALWALAQVLPWIPSYADDEVASAFLDATSGEPAVASVTVAAGSPSARLDTPELVVSLGLVPGLDRDALSALLARVQAGWAASELITARVDSLAVRVVPA
jgi:hypothetical protein